jgi:molecular chaperone HtpG
MLSEEINSTKKQVLCLYPTVDDKYFTLDELKENLKENKPIKMETSCSLCR